MAVSASYFLKSAQLNVAEGNWGRLWLLLALFGTIIACTRVRNSMPELFLWTPLLFYTLSFSHYNVRYGLELLPAFAIFAPLAVLSVIKHVQSKNLQIITTVAFFAFVLLSYGSIWGDPICFQEARANSRTRIALERELAAYLKALPQDSTLLMYLGD